MFHHVIYYDCARKICDSCSKKEKKRETGSDNKLFLSPNYLLICANCIASESLV